MFYLLSGSIRFVVCSFTEPWSCQQKIHRCDAAMVEKMPKQLEDVGGFVGILRYIAQFFQDAADDHLICIT